ncbi:MAG: class I SAM-dependent methyltransferase [Candidatus Poseidoniaceae archaeon]|jgi:hypothetical protein|nr:class I SAM-dependent methyltransferase [Candidatus Poseidoniaceae archaeon]
MRSGSTADHWQEVYSSNSPDEVGWYQMEHEVTINLVKASGIPLEGVIIDIGSGASTLLDELLKAGFSNIIAADICDEGMAHSRERLGDSVRWLVDDVTEPTKLLEIGTVDLWHDRAVLHFFTSQAEREGYVSTLKTILKVGGHAVIETFSEHGAPQCSGLDLQRYDEMMIRELLGDDFEMLETVRHVHLNPRGGERPYVSTLLKRLS